MPKNVLLLTVIDKRASMMATSAHVTNSLDPLHLFLTYIIYLSSSAVIDCHLLYCHVLYLHLSGIL